MDPRLQELLDHHEIRNLLAEYCNACDRCDEPRMAAVYCDDSWDDHGPRGGRGADFAAAIMAEMHENEGVSHLLGQSLIRVDGDLAGAETYFLAVIRVAGLEGVEQLSQLGGRFVDRLVREEGGWKIKHRTAIRDWSITLPVDADYVGGQGLTQGSRTGDDPAFAALGLVHSGIPGFVKVAA
jgi:ketosteroid isomerase-like protein